MAIPWKYLVLMKVRRFTKHNGLVAVLQIVCVPAFVWLVYKFGEIRKELSDFKVQVAREYATQVHINRLELKIDDLREMIWEIHNESTTKRHKKQ